MRHIRYVCGRKEKNITSGYSQIGDRYLCQRCDRTYRTFGTLKRHLRYECEKKPSISCPFSECSYKAKVNCRMLEHVRTVHKLAFTVKPRKPLTFDALE